MSILIFVQKTHFVYKKFKKFVFCTYLTLHLYKAKSARAALENHRGTLLFFIVMNCELCSLTLLNAPQCNYSLTSTALLAIISHYEPYDIAVADNSVCTVGFKIGIVESLVYLAEDAILMLVIYRARCAHIVSCTLI